MSKNYYSIRIRSETIKDLCKPDTVRRPDVGKKGGLQRLSCIKKGTEGEWVDLAWYLEKANVEKCQKDGETTLCPLNDRGKNELKYMNKIGDIEYIGEDEFRFI